MTITGGTAATNRITSVSDGTLTFNYSYDGCGNVLSDGSHTYKYDAANRLAQVDAGSTATYTYDAANRRVKAVALGVTTYSIWEGMQSILELDANGNVAAENVYAGARLLATERNGITLYQHPDRLSTRLLTNSSGAVAGTSSHLPFGEDGQETGAGDKHKFTTYERDGETGLDYSMNRQYVCGAGRFLQPDPIAGTLLAPQTLNRYPYAYNDAINLMDPSGLDPVVRIRPPDYINPQFGMSIFDLIRGGLSSTGLLGAVTFGWRLFPAGGDGPFSRIIEGAKFASSWFDIGAIDGSMTEGQRHTICMMDSGLDHAYFAKAFTAVVGTSVLIASTAENVEPGVLAYTWLKETTLSTTAGVNWNAGGHGIDVGPLQLNTYWTGRAVQKGLVSMDGLSWEGVLGNTLGANSAFGGNLLMHLQFAARYLNSLGSGADAVAAYAPPEHRAERRAEFSKLRSQLAAYFECMRKLGRK